MNKISSQDRASLIRLASSLPAGDETRKAILAGLAKIAKLPLQNFSAEEEAEFDPKIIAKVKKYLLTSRLKVTDDFSSDDVDFVQDNPKAPNALRDRGTGAVFTFGSAMGVGSAVKVDRRAAGYPTFYFVEPF